MVAEILLEAKGIDKIYKMGKSDVLALRNVDIKVKKGEYISIMGANVNELSGRERQRVARAIVVSPDIFVVDEPTGNLDSKTGEKILEIIEGQNKKGETIIMVTDEEEIGKRAKGKIKLKDGKNWKKSQRKNKTKRWKDIEG